MKTPLIYLHIGRGKTGTTAIQRFCNKNRLALANRGISYIAAGDEAAMGHQEFAQSFFDTIPDWMEVSSRLGWIQGAVRDKLLTKGDVFLFSSENFPLVCPGKVKAYFEEIFGTANFKIIFPGLS